MERIKAITLHDDGIYPNSQLPALHYKNVLDLPLLFRAWKVKALFHRNGWGNNWKAGIYSYHHYHSTTHEVLGCIRGKTAIRLGGDNGKTVILEKGDVLVIPAGVAHCNLEKERQVVCIGGYPNGRDYDMQYGLNGERPQSDRNIAAVPLPATDPVSGNSVPLLHFWEFSGHSRSETDTGSQKMPI